MMRFCGKCGQKIPEGGGFCPVCGTPVRSWTPEDDRIWNASGPAGRSAAGMNPGTPAGPTVGMKPGEPAGPAAGRGSGASGEPVPGASPEPEKVIIKTKEDTPEFKNYFNTPGDL